MSDFLSGTVFGSGSLRRLALGVAPVFAFGACLATPALAAPAVFAAPVEAVKSSGVIVIDDVAWKCGATGCASRELAAPAASACARVARKIGELSAFAVDGKAFDAAQLAECNDRAKGRKAARLKAQQANELASR